MTFNRLCILSRSVFYAAQRPVLQRKIPDHIPTSAVISVFARLSTRLLSLPSNQLKNITSQKRNHYSSKMSCEGDSCQSVTYDELRNVQKDSLALIIDVREPEEIYETGKLPGSIHIPMAEVVNSLMSLSSDEFKKKFQKDKPCKETKIILSCKGGRRSTAVKNELRKLGFHNAYSYDGGWMEWKKMQEA